MATILFSAAAFILAACGLAVGVLFGREPLKGVCGQCNCDLDSATRKCARRQPEQGS